MPAPEPLRMIVGMCSGGSRARWAALSFAAWGCTAELPEAICDGSPDIRLAVQALVPEERLAGGEHVMYDNGAGYLFVSGRCEYYVSWSGRFADARRGALRDTNALEDGLRLADVYENEGHYAGELFDGPTLKIAILGVTRRA